MACIILVNIPLQPLQPPFVKNYQHIHLSSPFLLEIIPFLHPSLPSSSPLAPPSLSLIRRGHLVYPLPLFWVLHLLFILGEVYVTDVEVHGAM